MADKAPFIEAFFDDATNTISYLVADMQAKKAAIIDPVLDYDHNSGRSTPFLSGQMSLALISSGRLKPTPMPTTCPARQ